MLESKLKQLFKKKLVKVFPTVSHWNISQGRFSQKGFPDTVFVINGSVGFFEAKQYGNKPTAIQLVAHESLARAGANIVILTTDKVEESYVFKKQIWSNGAMSELVWDTQFGAPDREFKKVIEEILWQRQ